MASLVSLMVASIPYYTVGRYFGGSYVNITQLIMLSLAMLGFLRLFLSQGRGPAFGAGTRLTVCVFFASIILGLVLSPYGDKVLTKGGIQIGGICVALLMSAIISREISRKPTLLVKIAEISVKSFGFFALFAIVQFVVWNVTRNTNILGFDFLNVMSGGDIWRGGGSIGPFVRANSWASEPAHFTRYLGFVLSFAFARLGLMGRSAKQAMRRIVPIWAAICIVAGFFVAFSILGLIQLVVTVAILFTFGGKIKPKTIVVGLVSVSIIGLSIILFAKMAGPQFESKLNTMSLLWNPDAGIGGKHVETEQITALAVSSNLQVAIENLKQDILFGGGVGSHGFAYDQFAPGVVFLNRTLYRLNADDAAGLGARLLSETGVIGFVSFISIFIFASRKSRRDVLRTAGGAPLDTIALIRLCFVISLLSVLFMYILRSGQYFDPLLYVLLGIVASSRQQRVPINTHSPQFLR
ncbi:hypothetical protein [Burkholderia vietnamiensis]|uniref:hypothetical protein n=1 Tax=Burkholderia vietnamiensis TaxID=60552 RepID=UPI000A813868|nr:hypothetical protein [Burkholderia vietnamiensis]MDN7927601.1 hypothetical protein [Burkholderia vietnamiensis]HDR9251113.1 hypothetical protein [Burkholderia vietnamiensis]